MRSVAIGHPGTWHDREDMAVTPDIDRLGRVQLHYAALENDATLASPRLFAGDPPDTRDLRGFTPLHFAAHQGSAQVARLLRDHGAEVDPANMFGNTPLFVAVVNSSGRGDVIGLLRQRGADPFRVNSAGQTPVGLARLIGNHDVAQYFSDLPD